jgi:hypothetical protein
MMLAQKNAANIQYLEERLKGLAELSKLQTQVTDNKNAISQMAKLAAQHLTQTTGISTSSVTPSALNSVSSIGSSSGNKLSPATAPVTDITPATTSA